MPGPYSAGLRSLVLAACDAHEGKRSEIAMRFRVSESTLYLWLQQRKLDGRTEAKPNTGGVASKVDGNRLVRLVREQERKGVIPNF